MCARVCMNVYEGTPSPRLSLSNLCENLLINTLVITEILITINVTSDSLPRWRRSSLLIGANSHNICDVPCHLSARRTTRDTAELKAADWASDLLRASGIFSYKSGHVWKSTSKRGYLLCESQPDDNTTSTIHTHTHVPTESKQWRIYPAFLWIFMKTPWPGLVFLTHHSPHLFCFI